MTSQTAIFRHLSLTTFFSLVVTLFPRAAAAEPAVDAASAVRYSADAPNLNVTPRRIVFSGGKRNEVVYVFNRGRTPVTVDVTLVDNVMLPSGEIVSVEAAGDRGDAAKAAVVRMRSAKDLLLATPSRLLLEAGKAKAVRIRAGLPAGDDAAAERRTHMTFTVVPPKDQGLTPEAAAASQSRAFVFSIRSVFGLSIPIIVRDAQQGSVARIDAISFSRGGLRGGASGAANSPPGLTFSLSRSGVNSVFGDLEAKVGGKRGGETVGFVRGVAVYPEIDERAMRLPLTRELRSGEKVTITYSNDEGNSRTVLTAASFTVP